MMLRYTFAREDLANRIETAVRKVLQLGLRGRIHAVDVDTSHFVGNQPEKASLEACDLPGRPTRQALARARWLEVLAPSPLAGPQREFE